MPPPMHPDIPIPTMLLRDGERVANAYLQVVAYSKHDRGVRSELHSRVSGPAVDGPRSCWIEV
jgi:hypothetical protein